MSPKSATNNRMAAKLAKTTNQLKTTTSKATSTAAAAAAAAAEINSLPSLPLPPSSSSSSPSSACIATVKEDEVAAEIEGAGVVAAFKAISASPPNPTPTKIDSYSKISVATTATPSTSVSMSARMSSAMNEGIMSYHNVIAMLTLLFLFCGLASVDGLKCYMCGQYNEGVGSITPCLNYSEQYAPLYLKDCPKKTEKFCVKYVSELSTVRDCATECAEKEIWETRTYCCNTDGCNGSGNVEASLPLILVPVAYFIYRAIRIKVQSMH